MATIDLENETLISFGGLADSLPPRRQERPVHVSTIHRWRSPGLKGIQLEAVRVGGAWHTTWEAFARFCARLTAIETGDAQPIVKIDREKEQHHADCILAAEKW